MINRKSRIHGEEGKETRERILRATIELMAEIGVDRLRTRGIAERARVNPALIHYHFGSMSALVMEAAEDALLRELGPSLEAFRTGATIGDSITAILEWIARYGERTPGSTILAEAMVKAHSGHRISQVDESGFAPVSASDSGAAPGCGGRGRARS